MFGYTSIKYINSYSFITSNYREVVIGQITLNTVYILHVCACVLIKKKYKCPRKDRKIIPASVKTLSIHGSLREKTYSTQGLIYVISLPAVFK